MCFALFAKALVAAEEAASSLAVWTSWDLRQKVGHRLYLGWRPSLVGRDESVCVFLHLLLVLVTTSKALVPSSVALVSTIFEVFLASTSTRPRMATITTIQRFVRYSSWLVQRDRAAVMVRWYCRCGLEMNRGHAWTFLAWFDFSWQTPATWSKYQQNCMKSFVSIEAC